MKGIIVATNYDDIIVPANLSSKRDKSISAKLNKIGVCKSSKSLIFNIVVKTVQTSYKSYIHKSAIENKHNVHDVH